MKTTRLSNLALKTFRSDDNKIIEGNGRVNETRVNLSDKFKNNKSKTLTHVANNKAIGKPNFLTLNAKKAFNQLQLAFIKALIFQNFDLKGHI